VLVAGKGHEEVQIIGDEKHPFSDRVQAGRALRRRREGPGESGAEGQAISVSGRRDAREEG
jgi:UDP-N-acetylmuramoyl-L-alanyl-D-glutamate--2,6-diaminopimelate ligase